MRQSYWSYVESVITPTEEESKEQPGLKRFWTFIKHSRSDTSGISSLSDETGNKVSAPDQVANIFNTPFQSVFTIESPVSHDLLPSISPFQSMPDTAFDIDTAFDRFTLQILANKSGGI